MIYPGAQWRPVTNHGGAIAPLMGIVVHHAVGSLDAAETRFNDPASQASAHFGVAYDGTVRQWVDTGSVAYHACRANWTGWIGIEHESSADPDHLYDPLTDAQVAATGGILRWLADTQGVILQVTDHVDSPGVAYHSMVPGPCDTHWGQTGCPGAAIIAQRQAIVNAAVGGSPPALPTGDDMIYRADTASATVPQVTAGSHWLIVGQYAKGTYLKAIDDPSKYPHSDVTGVDGEWLGQISVWNGGVGVGSTSNPITVQSTVTSVIK